MLGHHNNVQLQWTAERVVFIKGWSEFVRKFKMAVNHTIIFTIMDDGFDFDCTGRAPPWR
jgi:hypothetical protein